MPLKQTTLPDWIQSQLDAQIAAGNYPAGTELSDIILPSDYNALVVEVESKLATVDTDGTTVIGDGAGTKLSTYSTAYSVQSNNTAVDGVTSSNKALILGVPAFQITSGNMGQVTQNVDGVAQYVLQNTNRGASSSTGIVVENDNGTDTTFYGELGINSSVYTGTGALNAANNVYLHAPSSSVVLNSSGGDRSIRMTIAGAATDGFRVDLTGVGIGTNAATAKLDLVSTSIGSTPTVASGALIENTTVAAAGAQQWSPQLTLRGNGWKTNATAGSQTVDGRWVVVPVQGAANPTGQMQWGFSINGAAFNSAATLDSSGVFTITSLAANGSIYSSSGVTTGNFWVNSASTGTQTNASGLYFGTSGNISVRTAFNGTTNYTVPTSNNYGAVIVGAMAVTEASSGTHPVLANLLVRPPALTNAAGATTEACTVYIEGAPTGTVTSTNGNLALLVDSGNVRVDDNTGLGVAPTATAFVSIGASTTAKASLNIASGTAPTTPADGALWFDGTNLKMQVGGVTKTFVMV